MIQSDPFLNSGNLTNILQLTPTKSKAADFFKGTKTSLLNERTGEPQIRKDNKQLNGRRELTSYRQSTHLDADLKLGDVARLLGRRCRQIASNDFKAHQGKRKGWRTAQTRRSRLEVKTPRYLSGGWPRRRRRPRGRSAAASSPSRSLRESFSTVAGTFFPVPVRLF